MHYNVILILKNNVKNRIPKKTAQFQRNTSIIEHIEGAGTHFQVMFKQEEMKLENGNQKVHQSSF